MIARLIRGARFWATGTDAGQPLAVRAPNRALHVILAPACALAAAAMRAQDAPLAAWKLAAAVGLAYALLSLAKQRGDRGLAVPGVPPEVVAQDAAQDTRDLSLSLALWVLALAPVWWAPALALAAAAVAVLLIGAGKAPR